MRRLEELELPATAVLRGAAELALDGDYHDWVAPAQAAALGDFDVVVNLAYPASGSTFEYPARNAEIVDTIRALARRGGRVIHASTLAVFGLALERTPRPGPVASVRDDPYVEAKIEAESRLANEQEKLGLSLDIVRFGNIWGRASGAWAQPLAQRLLTGRPVAVREAPGYSNTTDVANAADYLTFLIRDGGKPSGVRYHHLAEFSHVRWGDWAGPMAARLGVESVYADDSALAMPNSGLHELAGVLAPVRPRNLYRGLAAERTTGSWTRSILRGLPGGARERLKPGVFFAQQPRPDRQEQVFLSIMAGRRRFASEADTMWIPPVSSELSMSRVLDWLSGE
jgi:nucleoside-diphosphate-sugar epimerase